MTVDRKKHKIPFAVPIPKNGENGISVTHSWDGTVLTITSASGTSSADLKANLTDVEKQEIATGISKLITKESIGLGNVDNTSDANKPVSDLQQQSIDEAISVHNTSNASHSDIRLLIEYLASRLNALANSDDTTLDQMSEIVAYIKANKNLIESVTTSKVNVSDIINNLTSNVSNKPLSASQGVVLKGLIDALTKNKLNATELPSAINTALAQAKASGDFDGKTPVKGVDYFTDIEQSNFVQAVISALPKYNGEVIEL